MVPTPDIDPIALPGGRVVPEHAVEEFATTSGGPGGQHANRSATRIEVRVRLDALPLSEAEHARVFERLGGRISGDGVLAVSARDYRSQLRNRQAARARMAELLAEALHVEPPRRPTKVPRGVRRRWRASKEQQSQRKQARRWRPGND